MNEFKKKLAFLIEQNKDNLLDSHAKYRGVYLTEVDMGEEGISLEVELDEGNIAFSLKVADDVCIDCGHDEFCADQTYTLNVVVNSSNEFLRNQGNTMEEAAYSSEKPSGPYQCLSCGKGYDDLSTLSCNVEKVSELIVEELKSQGIGVYTDYLAFENALDAYRGNSGERLE